MGQLRVQSFTVSLDGNGAGVMQPLADPGWCGGWGETPPYGGGIVVLGLCRRPAFARTGASFHRVAKGPEAAQHIVMAR